MLKMKCRLFAVAALIMFSLAGCGDTNDQTNGTLVLSAGGDNGVAASGKVNVSATATVTPAFPNYEVVITALLYSELGTVDSCTAKLNTNAAGTTGPLNCQLNQSQDRTTTLRITATSAGLAAIPVYTFDIPIFVPL